MPESHKINYIEMPSQDLAQTKTFFSSVFNWQFVDYGDSYTALEEAGIDGGFYLADTCMRADAGSALVVLYSNQLEETRDAVRAAGGQIIKPIFDFPGGRRFHFTCPSGNEFAVWSEPATGAGHVS
ncbi:VOC family protein [Alteromonas halophila]|nr:VOC family protein [Alteromonas halophila]